MNKIVEYMFFGLPIVCYDLREARVSADEAARYVEANSEEALARGILDLAGDAAVPGTDAELRHGPRAQRPGLGLFRAAASRRL